MEQIDHVLNLFEFTPSMHEIKLEKDVVLHVSVVVGKTCVFEVWRAAWVCLLLLLTFLPKCRQRASGRHGWHPSQGFACGCCAASKFFCEAAFVCLRSNAAEGASS